MSSERAYREVQQRGLNALASEGKLTDSGTAPMKKSALKKKTWPGTTMMAHQEKERESLGGYAVASTSSLSQSEEPRTSLRVETTTWIDPSPSYGRWDNGGRGAEHPFQRKAMIWFFGSASKAASTVVVAETFTMLILESNSTNLDSLSSSRMVCKRRWWCWAFA